MATITAEWTVLEKLLLAQAVYKFCEDNWFQIARNLKQLTMLDRQPDFFNQKVINQIKHTAYLYKTINYSILFF